ncbi:HAD family hydrolase [Micrococcoides hystricis]|uniref:HAD family hydrolase n=1 Tax=Micrococcoides hystricis TaxID=1572761 RepID=A0ABV6PDC8_9MICC
MSFPDAGTPALTQLPDEQKHQICLDVDGTLVDHYGHMNDRVREVCRALVEQGHHVQIATGRSLHATLPIIQQIGLTDGYSVVCNGAVTIRLDSSLEDGYEVIDKKTFDPKDALLKLREELPTAKYAVEGSDGNFYSTERFQDPSFGVRAIGVRFEDMLDVEAVRLVVFSTDSTAEEFGQTVEKLGLSGVTYSVGWTAWLDIAAAGISKASGCEALRQTLDVPLERTLAIGDGRNDIEMLEWVGHGVAMGQAPPEVKAVADEVTAHVDDDGAALVLERVLAASRPAQ